MDWSKILQSVLELIITTLVSALLAVAIGAVREWWKAQKTGKYAREMQVVLGVVSQAVAAAEQLGISGQLADFASDKLAYALNLADQLLIERYGIDLDMDHLRMLIEAQVRESFNYDRTAPPIEAVPQARLDNVTVSG